MHSDFLQSYGLAKFSSMTNPLTSNESLLYNDEPALIDWYLFVRLSASSSWRSLKGERVVGRVPFFSVSKTGKTGAPVDPLSILNVKGFWVSVPRLAN